MPKVIVMERMKEAHQKGKYGNPAFNCWGTTSYILNMRDNLTWVSRSEMARILEFNTVEIKKTELLRGDIVALYDDVYLVHTAVYLGRGKYFHKRGDSRSEITDFQGIMKSYWHDGVYFFRPFQVGR